MEYEFTPMPRILPELKDFSNAELRLLYVISELGTRKGRIVNFEATNSQLAGLAGINRNLVAKAIAGLVDKGYISKPSAKTTLKIRLTAATKSGTAATKSGTAATKSGTAATKSGSPYQTINQTINQTTNQTSTVDSVDISPYKHLLDDMEVVVGSKDLALELLYTVIGRRPDPESYIRATIGYVAQNATTNPAGMLVHLLRTNATRTSGKAKQAGGIDMAKYTTGKYAYLTQKREENERENS